VLDLRQERNARSIGEGHRIIYGVAGSGKTVILVARARLVAEDLRRRVLVLCYNVTLAEYFQRLFAQATNVTCLNFHKWGTQRNSIRFDDDDEVFGARLLQRLQHGEGEANTYDAVFIERLERGLMYVAMTRAGEMLAFTRSTLNGFASQIQQLIDLSRM